MMECKHPDLARMTAYSKGCKCRKCMKAMRDYHRAYRRNNPEIIRAIVLRGEARKAKT